MNLADLRREYAKASLDESTTSADPLEQFARWFSEAQAGGVVEPNAMTLATVDADGQPSARIVLLKGVSAGGFVFFSDHRSRKGLELAANPAVALVFHWGDLERQVRVRGTVGLIDAAETAAYFKSRPEGSRIGAWASYQSAVLGDRAELERSWDQVAQRFAGREIPVPPHWGGYRVTPQEVEFWQGRQNRLHDRILYTRSSEHAWRRVRLSP